MKLNNKILSGLALGLSLTAAACSNGQPDTQQPVNQNKDTTMGHPEISKEDTADVPVSHDPNYCPACGMG